MYDPVAKYKEEFLMCQTQEDFEKYFLKYAHSQDNPYLEKVKQIILKKEKLKKENSYGLAIFLFIFGVGFFVFLFFMSSKNADNFSDRTAYRIIASVCGSPFIIYPLYMLIKTIKVRFRNK